MVVKTQLLQTRYNGHVSHFSVIFHVMVLGPLKEVIKSNLETWGETNISGIRNSECNAAICHSWPDGALRAS